MSKSDKKLPVVAGELTPVAAVSTPRSVVTVLAQTSPWAAVVFYAIQAGWPPEQVNYLIITLLPIIALHAILGRP